MTENLSKKLTVEMVVEAGLKERKFGRLQLNQKVKNEIERWVIFSIFAGRHMTALTGGAARPTFARQPIPT